MLVIGIAGGSGSGKSTVAEAIVNKLGTNNVVLISQDSYYADNTHLSPEQRQQINYDHPDSFDNSLLIEHIHQLSDNEPIQVPVYDFTVHTRSQKTIEVTPKAVLVLEGILVLADSALRDVLDIKVFVDTEADVRVLRRVVRDINERGRTLESVHTQYLTTVKPMHDAFIEPSKKYADLIIPEGGHNQIAINVLTSLVEGYIKKQETAAP